MMEDITVGAAAGAVTTSFRNIGLRMIRHGLDDCFSESVKKTAEHFFEHPKALNSGAPVRAAAIGLSKFLLSPQTTQSINTMIGDIFDKKSPSNSPRTSQQKKELALTQLNATKGSDSSKGK
jgi:hypothetical protein